MLFCQDTHWARFTSGTGIINPCGAFDLGPLPRYGNITPDSMPRYGEPMGRGGPPLPPLRLSSQPLRWEEPSPIQHPLYGTEIDGTYICLRTCPRDETQ